MLRRHVAAQSRPIPLAVSLPALSLGAGACLVFKGSGFYQTDYRSESYKKAASADKPAGAPAASSCSR